MPALLPTSHRKSFAIRRDSWRLVSTLLLASLLAGCGDAAQRAVALPFLQSGGHEIRSLHALRYTVTMPATFRATLVDDRHDRFNGHPFDISRAALIDRHAAVMVHAETVADGNGASNYDELPVAMLDGHSFRVRPRSCQQLGVGDLAGESDLEWLASKGFSPTGPLAVAQYLASTPDHNAEIVITLMARVLACSDVAMNEALEQLGTRVTVRTATD